MVTKRVTENVWLTPALMGDVTEYTQVQKLSNFLQKCTYVQTSVNYFHKTAAGAGLFTVLPPFNRKSVSQYSTPHGR